MLTAGKVHLYCCVSLAAVCSIVWPVQLASAGEHLLVSLMRHRIMAAVMCDMSANMRYMLSSHCTVHCSDLLCSVQSLALPPKSVAF